DPAFVARKLNCLKILLLLEPDNQGLLGQLCRGYFDLALDYAELPRCRRHLLDAMRFGQDLLKLAPHDMLALSVLAEIDWLFGDTPAAVAKWRTLSAQIGDAATAARIDRRIEVCNGEIRLDAALVDDLELLAEAVHLHAIGDNPRALRLLERLEGEGFLMKALPSAEFFWLLGTCRRECGDPSGAAVAWNKALEIEPEHTASLAALASAPGV
ncbi:MAG TPA: hypothetical protein VLL73_05275, partial [Desulfurivibrionaceae bacterium]|nr:hypothetical protein [Desulfurivibrionaceae bacterium]